MIEIEKQECRTHSCFFQTRCCTDKGDCMKKWRIIGFCLLLCSMMTGCKLKDAVVWDKQTTTSQQDLNSKELVVEEQMPLEEELPEEDLTIEHVKEQLLQAICEQQDVCEMAFLTYDMTAEDVTALLNQLAEWDDLYFQYYVSAIEYEVVQIVPGDTPYVELALALEYYDDCVKCDAMYHVYDAEDVYDAFADSLQTGFEKTVLYIHKEGDFYVEPKELAYYADQVSWDYSMQMPYVYRQLMHTVYEEESGDCLLVVSQEYDIYQLTEQHQMDAQVLVEQEVEALAQQVREYSDSRDEQYEYLYKLISERVRFDYELSDLLLDVYHADNPSISIGRGIYGALLEGESVCSGYAAAYKAVCDVLEIPCMVLIGYAEEGDHAWNMIIKEDGTIGYVDVTWGDSAKWYQTYFDIDEKVMQQENRRIYDYLYIPEEYVEAGFALERAPQFLYDDVLENS